MSELLLYYKCAKLTRVRFLPRSERNSETRRLHSFVLCLSVWFLSSTGTQPAASSDDYLKTFQYHHIFLNNYILYFQADVDNVGSDFDLNSLIEGDVDDDEFGEHFTNKEDREESKTPVVSFYEPLKVRHSFTTNNIVKPWFGYKN